MSLITKTFRLRWHLVALVVAAMLPFFIFSAFMVQKMTRYERAFSERKLQTAAFELSGTLDQEFESTIRTLNALAASEDLRGHHFKRFYDTLLKIQRTQSNWKAILVHTPDLKPVLRSNRPFHEKLVGPAEPQSLNDLFLTGQPTISSIAPGPSGGFAFAIRVPVWEGGKIIYALSAVISLNSIQDLLVRSSFQNSSDLASTIVDQTGRVVARSRSPEKYVGQMAGPEYLKAISANEYGLDKSRALDGRDVYFAFQRSRTSHWTASVNVDREVLDAPLIKARLLVLLVGLLLLLSFGGLAFTYSASLTRQIRSAAQGAMQLARGNEPQIEKSSVSEVEQLRTSMLAAAELLQQREKEKNDLLEQAHVARLDAEEASRAKTYFLANMSHEIRTPLGIVLGFTELFANDEIPQEEKEENLNIVRRNGQLLLTLIDDILDLSKVEANKLTILKKDFSIRELVQRTVGDLTSKAIAKGLELQFQYGPYIPEQIHSDPIRLRQIVYNILGNAIKFTSHGRIFVDMKMIDHKIEIRIQDSGIGIAPDQQKKLFKLFSQAESGHSREFGGTGLGLALSRRLAQLLGGDVELFESTLGKGSVFRITIPSG